MPLRQGNIDKLFTGLQFMILGDSARTAGFFTERRTAFDAPECGHCAWCEDLLYNRAQCRCQGMRQAGVTLTA